MATFSQLVDSLVSETKRPDLRAEIATYLNLTIREVHFDPKSGSVVFYKDNGWEAQVTVDSVTRQIWRIPSNATFQAVTAVRFDGVYDTQGRSVYAKQTPPGPRLGSELYYWYRAAETIVFGGRIGYGSLGGTISLFYYQYPSGLKYYTEADRPATWDLITGWTYADAYDVDNDTRETARGLVTNWLLERWDQVIAEGVRAKIYKRLGDPRQAICYSLFMQLRQGLYTSEIADVSGYY